MATFSQKGYASTTLVNIAKEAEVTRGAIYWHFGSKAELYNTLIREYSDRGISIMQQAVSEGGTLLDILKRVFVRQLQAVADDADLRALIELQLFKTGLVPELEEGHQQQIAASIGLIEMMAGIMKQGIDTGLLRSDTDPKEIAISYLAFQNGLIHLWLIAPNEFSLKDSAERFAELFMQSLAA